MADTDKLRPEVAEAVERMCTPMGTKYVYTERRDAACMATIRAELLRLADENAQLRDVLADRDMDREMAAHANRELAALKARAQWQPIETAPEDGTRVLVYSLGSPLCVAQYRLGVWVTADTETDALCVVSPASWMPLPAPPAEQENG